MSTTQLPTAVPAAAAQTDPAPSSPVSGDDPAGVSRFLMYTLSLPERVVRSTVGVTAGAAREAAHALVPQAFKSSKVYELVIANSLRFLTEEIGGVEHQVRPGENAKLDNYLARKAVGDFVDLAGLATLHLSPIWVFAVVSDVAYGSKTYLNELSAELRERGLIREDSSIDRVEDLLDAIHSSTAETASLIATPPLSIAQLKQSVEKIRLVDPTTLLPQQELSAQWDEIRQIAKKEDVSLLGVSGALTMHMLKKVGAVAEGTLTGVEVAGGLFNRNVLGHYASGLQAVREHGFYPLILASSAPYRKAVWTNFAAGQETLTSRIVTGRLFRQVWDAARRKLQTKQQG
ncbi:MAG TPA: hypothetical protein VGP63_02180 [Planctomycetaceae bacterium]|jgi:hypothetical protein|nr:hypothetical protein [Planctomycetaceae bacterium]